MAANGCKWMQMDAKGRKWLQIAANGCKLLNMAENGSKMPQQYTVDVRQYTIEMSPKQKLHQN